MRTPTIDTEGFPQYFKESERCCSTKPIQLLQVEGHSKINHIFILLENEYYVLSEELTATWSV